MNITTLLVANRGEIARRVIRTARRWACGAVAVLRRRRRRTRRSCRCRRRGPPRRRLPRRRRDRRGRQRTGADAIHPGYGFLSENAAFARAVEAAGIAWVGPAPGGHRGHGRQARGQEAPRSRPACRHCRRRGPDDAERVGYPVLVKAAAGGGGKGMRDRRAPAELAEAVAAAQREAAGAFGDGTRVPRALRAADRATSRSRSSATRTATSCTSASASARSSAATRRSSRSHRRRWSTTRCERRMGEAALALAQAIGYQSAGTVEFLVDDDTGEFFFLEVNTRLQVEHPVTEEVTGIDLVREQLRVAEGKPLGFAQDDVDVHRPRDRGPAVRRGPGGGFLPATGTIAVFEPAAEPAVRWESGVEAGSVVGVEFDPMLAKVIAHGPTRAEAARAARARPRAAAPRAASRPTATSSSPRCATRRSSPATRRPTSSSGTTRPARRDLDEDELRSRRSRRRAVAAGRNRATATVLPSCRAAGATPCCPPRRSRFTHGDDRIGVTYQPRRDGRSRSATGIAACHSWTADGIDVEIDGRRRATASRTVWASGCTCRLPRGTVDLDVVPRFVCPAHRHSVAASWRRCPASCSTSLSRPATSVTAGQTLVVLEAMKMEHRIERGRRRHGRRGARRAPDSRSRRRPARRARGRRTTERDDGRTDPHRQLLGLLRRPAVGRSRDGRGRARSTCSPATGWPS